MSQKLFNDFNAVSAKQWKQKIQFDLQGEDYNDALVWKTNEDILVKPFYHADDFKTPPPLHNTKASEWKIGQNIFVADTKKSNLNAITAIENGAESIAFTIASDEVLITELLQNIDLNLVEIHLNLKFSSEAYLKSIPLNTNVFVHTDIINNLAETGNWYKNLNHDFSSFLNSYTYINSITVNSTLYQNSGANMVQQLAYALAHANEYINQLEIAGKNLTHIIPNFKVAIGSNYFFEIAKLKALRLLWDSLAKAYNIKSKCNIIAIPTKRNKTLLDKENNITRTTTECMSAILGGANTIFNLPFDAIYKKTNAFSTQIARNQLLILKHESYFNKVNNPTDGAYYIETITQQLAEKALDLFKNIEKNGGFLKQLKTGTIQRKIKESALKEEQQFKNNQLIIVGTNKYEANEHNIKNNIEIYPFVKTKPRKTLIEPIIEKRITENFEKSRLNYEN
ncbi:methylmalonyl-CoA mutase subunit beta [Tamlana sp. 62-3]|uniref:Methylmalonyl-CoA mutase subunit beta n=1 Tax=Neotamlana sargassicola TaxID=2883125 RepID=A0A9X1I8H7_9FLAO|nr:methylmalonyl-CoA mutase subunit beta [Tamlana sargassicola]MCB4809423.1 methylmalonyl-CoA mutase subunit beta [Tamlana sargassicola]